MSLEGRVAVVTGAGTGLGSAIASSLAAAGADVMLHYRGSAESAERVAQACRDLGRRAETHRADFGADAGSAAAVVDAAAERFGRVDILVNNAAVTGEGEPLETHRRALFEEVMAVNVVAPFLATQAAARHMAATGSGGRIINIGSVHGRQATPTTTAYDTSKGAIAALTFASAIALGPSGITVNCVAPGAIVVERYDDLDWDEEWFISRTPVRRNGRPGDIAAIVCYLASDDAGFITGETIHVDGGLTRLLPIVR